MNKTFRGTIEHIKYQIIHKKNSQSIIWYRNMW